MNKYRVNGFLRQLIFIMAFFLVSASNASLVDAEEVVLRPGYISGNIQVGSETLNVVHIYGSWDQYSASTNIYPNATSGTYTLTVNVPEGTEPDYKVYADAYMDNSKDYMYLGPQTVTVSAFETSTADLVVTPGYIKGAITVEGGSLSSAYIYAYQSSTQSSTSAYTNSRTSTSSSSFRFPVVPNDNIKVYGYAYVEGTRIELEAEYVAVSAGETASVNWTITYTPQVTGNIVGDMQINGAANLDRHYVYVGGPSYKNTTLTANGPYSLTNLSPGTYYMYAYSYFNGSDDRFRYPYSSFSPTYRPTVSSGATTTVNISADAAFINGNISLTGTASLSDATYARIEAVGIYGSDSYGGRSDDIVNTGTGNYDLIVSDESWSPYLLYLRFYNTDPEDYRQHYLYFYDYQSYYNPISLTAGETAIRNFSYGTGTVTIIFRVLGGGTLSYPRLNGSCSEYDDSNQLQWSYSFYAYNQSMVNVEEGSVTFVGMKANCTIDAFAYVGGSYTKFGRISVDVVPGTEQEIDIGGPTLTIEFPEPDYITSNSSITVYGTATDDVEVASITVNGVEASLTSTNNADDLAEVSFSATIDLLNRGPNEIETIATDTSEKSASDKRTVYRDEGLPELDWTPAHGTTTNSSEILVQGTATDDAGIKSITVNGESVAFQSTDNPDDPNEVSFSATLTLVEGDNYITVVAMDISTRSTSQTHRVIYIVNQPPEADAGPDMAYEQSVYQGANVPLDGSGSTDDGQLQPLTYTWTWIGGSVTGVNPTVLLPLGTTTITLTVYDGQYSATDTVVITVVDTRPPVLTVPADVTVEQETKDGTVVSLTATATDICDADVTITSDELAIYPLGTTTVTFTATDDSGNSVSKSMTVTVVDTTPPLVDAGPDVTVEQVTAAGTEVTLSGSASDICDASLDYEWSEDGTVIGNVPTLTKVFNLGTHTLTLKATDDSGNVGTDTVVVNVIDTTPPELSVTPSVTTLRPPNHEYVTVTIDYEVYDICDAEPEVTLVSVTSDEPEIGMCDPTLNDIVIVDNTTIELRAERQCMGDGRVYTINYSATDDSGNVGTASAIVTVPLHHNGEAIE